MQGYTYQKFYLKINIFYFKKYNSSIQKNHRLIRKTSSKIKCIKKASSFKRGSRNKIKERMGVNVNIINVKKTVLI